MLNYSCIYLDPPFGRVYAAQAMKRNAEIEIWRFLMAMVIVNCHCMYLRCGLIFPFGRIGVEFFFLLSGYLLAASAMRQVSKKPNPTWNEIHNETASLIGKRFASFFPETLIVCVLTCAIYCIIYYSHLTDCIMMCSRSLFGDVFCLRMTGLVGGGSNGAAWYLSTLMLSSALLYPILRRWGVSPAYCSVGWLLLGAIYLKGTACDLGGIREIIGTYKGNIRGFSEMLIGASLLPLTMKIRNVPFSRFGRLVLTLIKWAMCVIVFLFVRRASHFEHDFGMAMMALCVLLVLMFSEKCLDAKWYQHPISLFLGRFSLVLFLSHHFYAFYLRRMLPPELSHVQIVIIYYVCSFATAFLVMGLAGKVRSLLSLMLDKSDAPSEKT